jgi:hypothetical protein
MQRLTLAGRLLITALVLAVAYFGFRYFAANHPVEPVVTTTSSAGSTSSAPTDGSTPADATAPTDAAPATSGGAFTYTTPEPVGGKLKGVVELGASGFNSFIVRIDQERRWKLEKAEFGNSLVLENMASDDDIRAGLKAYIGKMLDFGVGGRDIHFVVSSGAAKAEGTAKITKALKALGYVVNTVSPTQEGTYGLQTVLPAEYAGKSFVVDIGSGNTKISWKAGSSLQSVETYGAKYFQNNISDDVVIAEVKQKAEQVPAEQRGTCFIIGGVPFEMAKAVRQGKERYTVLKAPGEYQLENAKSKAGLTIYKAVAEATGCKQFVFDWDANFTIGYLLSLPQ